MTARRPHICVVGSSNIDLLFRTPRLPRAGETLEGKTFHVGYGGKGANQAVMAARFGARVTMLSRVGKDDFGERTLANYRAQGIDTRYVLVDEARPSGVAGIVVDDDARNCIIIVPGANLGLSPDDIRAAAGVLRTADLVLCQCETPVETTHEAFRLARSAGVRTILNPAPATSLPDELLRLTDLCVPNESELETLTGQPVATVEQAESAACMLLRRGPAAVLVTLGDRGALIVTDEVREHIPAVTVAAVDSTGAGDAFIGSLAVFLGEQAPLREAVSRANAAAALSVTRLGTQTSFPTRAEFDAFIPGRN